MFKTDTPRYSAVEPITRKGKARYKPFEELGVTEAQMQYITEHYGQRPLVLLAQECDLPTAHAHRVKEKLKREGKLPEGPGHNWRDTMKAKGYEPNNRPIVSIGGILKPVAETSMEAIGDPRCVHHRVCISIGDGRERQTYKLCGDVKIVRLW